MDADIISKAKLLWNEGEQRTSFEDDYAFHTINGLIFRWANNFLMARPVKSTEEQYWETYRVYDTKECDAWFVWLTVGSVKEVMKLITAGLIPNKKYIIFKHRDKFKTIETQRLI